MHFVVRGPGAKSSCPEHHKRISAASMYYLSNHTDQWRASAERSPNRYVVVFASAASKEGGRSVSCCCSAGRMKCGVLNCIVKIGASATFPPLFLAWLHQASFPPPSTAFVKTYTIASYCLEMSATVTIRGKNREISNSVDEPPSAGANDSQQALKNPSRGLCQTQAG